MIDLMQLAPVKAAGWDWLQPEAINNLGQIVGHGSFNGSARQAFLLSPFPIPIITPVPEPETYAMLLVGLSLLAFLVHRRKESAM